MKTSIALATWNGSRYLAEQLQSLADQVRPPDELVVVDDCSGDQTLEILCKFAEQADFSVHIHQNSQNSGSTAAFEKAASLCSGDVIAFCDQDDVWYPQKLQRLLAEFEDHPEAAVVCCDGDLVDERLQSLKDSIWRANGFASQEAQRYLSQHGTFAAQLRRNAVCGAGMMVRRSFADTFLPIPTCWVHDAWISTVLAAMAPIRFVHQPLFAYRQHASQQIGERRFSFWQQLQKARSMDQAFFQRELEKSIHLCERLRVADAPEACQQLATDRRWYSECRAQLGEQSFHARVATAIKLAASGQYDSFAFGWKSLLQDSFLRRH